MRALSPEKVVIASLLEEEAQAACEDHRAEYGEDVQFIPAWGNLFVPTEMSELHRSTILGDTALRSQLLDALYGSFDSAFEDNALVNMIREHRPEVVVDAVNTATSFSYQDVFDGVAKVRDWISEEGFKAEQGSALRPAMGFSSFAGVNGQLNRLALTLSK